MDIVLNDEKCTFKTVYMHYKAARHNLRSSLDFGWEKSLMEKKSNIVERRKEKSSE